MILCNMDYNEIRDKELKTVLHLLLILQHTKKLHPKEQTVLDILNNHFPIVAEEKSAIYENAKTNNTKSKQDFINAHGIHGRFYSKEQNLLYHPFLYCSIFHLDNINTFLG